MSKSLLYPSLPVGTKKGFTSFQFLVPIRIRGTCCWGHVDTGALVSSIPYKISKIIGIDPEEKREEGIYNFVGGIPIPFGIEKLDLEILPPNENLSNEWWKTLPSGESKIEDYYKEISPACVLENRTFRIDKKRISEISNKLYINDDSLEVGERDPHGFIFLGAVNILEKLKIETVKRNGEIFIKISEF